MDAAVTVSGDVTGATQVPGGECHRVTTILPWVWRPACMVTASRIFSTGKAAATGTVIWPATMASAIRVRASGGASMEPVRRTPAGGLGTAAIMETRSG